MKTISTLAIAAILLAPALGNAKCDLSPVLQRETKVVDTRIFEAESTTVGPYKIFGGCKTATAEKKALKQCTKAGYVNCHEVDYYWSYPANGLSTYCSSKIEGQKVEVITRTEAEIRDANCSKFIACAHEDAVEGTNPVTTAKIERLVHLYCN